MILRYLKSFLPILAFAVVFFAAGNGEAQIPQTINYQGYLTDSAGTPVNKAVNVTFRLYAAASGGERVWEETQSGVGVTNGLFNAVLGSNNALKIPFDVPYFLSVQINSDAEMEKRQPLSAVPYALRADTANAVAAGATIAASQLTGSITTATIPVANVIGAVAGPAGPTGPQGPAGVQGPAGAQGPVGPLPTVRVASMPNCCFSIDNLAVGEANAQPVLLKNTGGAGTFLVRVDAQLNNFGTLYFNYHCKLQSLAYPAILGTPFSDIAGTRRDVHWRTGKDSSGNSTGANGVSISMQAAVSAGILSTDVRLVCWGTWDGNSPPIVDYGYGVESAILTLQPIGGIS